MWKYPLLFLLILNSAIAGEVAPKFTFQGRLFNVAGTEPLTEIVNLKLQILSPSGSCLLYEESQVVDTSNTEGTFSVEIGSPPGNAKRTASDPQLNMARVFKNDTSTQTLAASANCVSAYTPSAGDARILRVIITPSSTNIPEVLSPDQVINSVPNAIVSETLQGLTPDNFVKKDTTFVTNENVKKLFGSAEDGVVDASDLHHHDDRYLQTSVSGTPTTGQILRFNGTSWIADDEAGGSSFTGTPNKAVITDATGALAAAAVSNTELSHLQGVTSSIQTQLNARALLTGANFTGSVTSTSSFSGTAFYYTSDRRFKKDIKTFEKALDTLFKLRGVRFNWKNSGSPEIGFIAQEVEEVLPELVMTKEDGDRHKAVKYGNITAVLVEALKEVETKHTKEEKKLRREISSIKKENEQLKKDYQELREEMKALRELIKAKAN